MKIASITILVLLLMGVIRTEGNAQLSITMSNPVNQNLLDQYVGDIYGPGIELIPGTSSITGNNMQIGRFTITGTPTIIPFSSGIVLSTGQVIRIPLLFGSNNLNDAMTPLGVADQGDPVLNPLAVGGAKDVITIRFSFRSTTSMIVFEYSAGTDEWPDSISGMGRNDLFGFFISGPDPFGGNYMNRNMASTTDGIGAGMQEIFNGDTTNHWDTRTGTYQHFNALSKARRCSLRVLPCVDYILEIKLADTGDEVNDSGLFLKLDGFTAVEDTLQPVHVVLNYPPGDTAITEECTSAELVFTKTDPGSLANPVIVRLGYWGSATNGVDLNLLPDSVIIPAGQNSLTLPVNTIADAIPEGLETLFIRYSPLCGIQDTLILHIKDYTPLALSADSIPPVCSGQGPVQLKVQISGGAAPLQSQWDQNLGTETEVTVNPVQTTTYTFTVTDACGNNVSKQITVMVGLTPLAEAGPDFSIPEGEIAQIGFSGEPGVFYQWSPSSNLDNPGIPNPRFTAPSGQSGVLMYVLTATGTGSCIARDTLLITVTRRPVAQFISPAGQCYRGNLFEFAPSGIVSPTATFLWDFGPVAEPSQSTLRNPSGIHFTQTGSHPVRLIVTDNGLESIPFTGFIEVYEMPVANFTANIFEGCAPVSVSFVNLSESQPLSYLWDFGNQRASLTEEPKIVFAEPGSFTVSLMVNNQWGCRDTYRIENMIRVFETPNARFSVQPNRTTIDQPNFSIQDISGYMGPCFYSLGNGDTLRKKSGEVSYPDTGTFVITQVLGAGEKCSDTASMVVRIDPGFKIYIPSAFTPNNDDENDLFRAYGEDILNFHMLIYNRWGELMYESYDISNGWDGRIRLGTKAVPGETFVYVIRVKDIYGLDHHYTGNVFVLR